MPAAISLAHRLDCGGNAVHRLAIALDRARIRRARAGRPAEIVQVMTSASVLEPREMVKVPAIGKRSASTENDTRHIFLSLKSAR